ncbi:MAG: hypothetical protein C5B48_15190, partial [Candidatus Rokuibacteriota bacterium]
MWIHEPNGTPYRPWGGAWVSLETGLANVKPGASNPGDAALAVEALVELGLRFAQTRPAAIQVVDQVLGEEIARALGDPDLRVTVVPRLDAVNAMVARMTAEMEGEPPPPALDAPGVTVEGMRAFAIAARDFYAARPWRHLSDEDLIHVEEPTVAAPFRHFTVLGRAGQTFGLGFFPSRAAFDELHASLDSEVLLKGRGSWSVFFGPPWTTPWSDLELWEEHGFPLAAPEAYPIAGRFSAVVRMRRPDARELSDIEAILLALSRVTEAEIDEGRFSYEVIGHAGRRRVTLTIPELLQPLEAEAPPARRRMPDRRVMERALLEMQRFIAAGEFAGPAELNKALEAKFRGPVDKIA